jgi:hypothetical protein
MELSMTASPTPKRPWPRNLRSRPPALADVLADPRARKRERRTNLAVKRAYYRLADEKRETILVACSKCDWRAAFARDDLIASHGEDYAMPNLLNHLAAPGCSRLGSHWDRCGVHYVEPIEGSR